MNIAEITTFTEGGAYTHVIELIKGMKQNFLILTGNTTKSGYEIYDGNRYYHFPTVLRIMDIFFMNKPGSYKEALDVLEKNKIDIIHIHAYLYTFLLHMWMHKNKKPTIITIHYLLELKANPLTARIYRKVAKSVTLLLARKADRMICVNEDYVDTFIGWGVDPKKVIYMPNGVDTKKFSPGGSNARKKYKDDKLIVYFGRLHYQKNVDTLIRSFKQIHGKIKNAKLIIVGDGCESNTLKKQIGDDKDIIMTGFVSDEELVDYIRAADVVVFPSRGENASFTLLEAMACQVPVVSSDVGTAKRILGADRGILLKALNEEDITESCMSILSNNGMATKMAKEARDYVCENYSWSMIREKTEKIYESLIGG